MLYSILNAEAGTWWYHEKLRREGRADEARQAERISIKGWVKDIRQAMSFSQACVLIGSDNHSWTFYYGEGRKVEVPGRLAIRDWIAERFPTIDCRGADASKLVKVIWNGPVFGISENVKESGPWTALDEAPLHAIAPLYRAAGCTVTNI